MEAVENFRKKKKKDRTVMKLKTRIILGFTMIILMPLLLFAATLYGFSQSQAQKTQAVTESDGTVYDISITDSADSQGRVHVMAKDLFISAFVILISVALVVGLWVYRSIAVPLVKLKKATQNIKEGNLDFVLDVEGKDEFSELCQDFEEMRRRLKESTEEKSLIEKENRELISNISHDLKTPITAVKGYVEGIMDGVADTPEKMDRYVRTIYNKTNEMDHLINELTFYSKIDTNRIPYTFNKLNVEDYFEDCSEEVGLELETRGIELVYANYVEKDVMVIAGSRSAVLSITLSATLSNIWTSLKESFRSESRMWVILSRLRLRTMEKVLARRICLIFSTVFTVQMFHEILPKAEAESVFPL